MDPGPSTTTNAVLIGGDIDQVVPGTERLRPLRRIFAADATILLISHDDDAVGGTLLLAQEIHYLLEEDAPPPRGLQSP